ncbi:hypothetical protein CKM354_001297000 [Cercospora kikuchii]|uniref:Uncharacterized protein n=1 Tax=Cercospora kikuchii TaxID=84275 RepID=A0A9P3FN61_9PEZI|nr:uncharacterized protein CKM354_001297000 [Cercospora kikuchii]GIZ49954.1 hypothetical protein CKM354_001297000 [Cercospora kikuchii]
MVSLSLLRLWLLWLCSAHCIATAHRYIIVELDGATPLSTEHLLHDLAALAAQEAADGSSIVVRKRRDLHSDLFHGFSVDVTFRDGPEDIAAVHGAIRRHHAVRNAWIGSAGAARPSANPPAQSTPLRRHARRETASHPPHAQIGVDRLHAAGVRGKGIRIAILDSGFDYRQAPFQYAIGPGNKITYGRTWIGDSGMNTGPDDDPYAECSHHGTHVLGIVAADPTDFGVVGVAPEATIELHRVFDCDDNTDEDTLLSALTAAWQRGVDVINCSWGLSDSYESATSILAARIMKNGTYVQFTAGNSGPRPFTIHAPGATHGIPAVGSVDCASSAAYFWNGSLSSDDVQHRIRWVPGRTNYTVTTFPPHLDVWAPLESIPEHMPWQPDAFPAHLAVPDMDKTLFMVRLDFFAIHHEQIVARIKPRYVLLYHPAGGDLAFPGMYFPSWPLSELPDTSALGTIEHATAVKMLHDIMQGRRVTISLAREDAHADQVVYAVNARTGGRMTENSGWLPTVSGEGGVTFAAPGGRILSTLPRLYGGFGQLTGTSMAAPLVAGVAALLKQLHPSWTPDDIRNVLATTARPMPYTDNSTHDYGFLAPVIQQGGGLIDAWSAAHTTTVLNVSALDFLDLRRQPKSLAFSLTNMGDETVTFNVGHIGAASGYAKTASPDIAFADDKHLEQSQSLMAIYADVQVHPEALRLVPGETAVVRVAVTAPARLNPSRLPFYGGYIALNSTDGAQNLTVPYSGIAARLPDDFPLVAPKTVRSAVYIPSKNALVSCPYNTTFKLSLVDNTVRFLADAWPAVTFGTPPLVVRKARVSIIDTASQQAIVTHTLTHLDWKAKRWHWDGSSISSTAVSGSRHVWRLQYLGLLAREEEEWTTIDTESFSIEDKRQLEQNVATVPELEDIPCDIEASQGFRSR